MADSRFGGTRLPVLTCARAITHAGRLHVDAAGAQSFYTPSAPPRWVFATDHRPGEKALAGIFLLLLRMTRDEAIPQMSAWFSHDQHGARSPNSQVSTFALVD